MSSKGHRLLDVSCCVRAECQRCEHVDGEGGLLLGRIMPKGRDAESIVSYCSVVHWVAVRPSDHA